MSGGRDKNFYHYDNLLDANVVIIYLKGKFDSKM